MTPRKYQMGRRISAVEETKGRIIMATFELHNEQGVAATTLADVARRADVALGTVYKHFASVDDLVMGCAGRVASLLDAPGLSIFDDLVSVEDRVAALVRERFAMYERGARQIWVARCEQDRVAALRGWADHDAASHSALVRAALRTVTPNAAAIRGALALTDFYVWKAFHEKGVPTQQATVIITAAVLTRIAGAVAPKGNMP